MAYACSNAPMGASLWHNETIMFERVRRRAVAYDIFCQNQYITDWFRSIPSPFFASSYLHSPYLHLLPCSLSPFPTSRHCSSSFLTHHIITRTFLHATFTCYFDFRALVPHFALSWPLNEFDLICTLPRPDNISSSFMIHDSLFFIQTSFSS